MRFLLLTETTPDDWALDEWRKNHLSAFIIFRPVSLITRIVRKIWIKLNLPCQFLWYSSLWKNEVKKADIVVVHMSGLQTTLPKYINKLNPKAKVIAWYWNCVAVSVPPSKIKGNCEVWSFDPEDCAKYGMHFNHQYYFKSLIQPKNKDYDYDVYFCGSDSGRGETLVAIYNFLSKMKLNVFFQIVYPIYEGIPAELRSPKISYKRMVENISKSRCLLEIPREGQSGATIRLMEALFNKKKVITTNKAVKKEPFYNPQNIFIIGERDEKDLLDFLKSDYVDANFDFVEKYDVKNWLNNFLS